MLAHGCTLFNQSCEGHSPGELISGTPRANVRCVREFSGSAVRLGGRDAAFVMRILSIARHRKLPLAPAVTAAADLEGLGHARKFAASVDGLDDARFLDLLEAALERSGDPSAANVLAALRRAGLPPEGLRGLADWLNERSAARHRMFTAISYPFSLMITAALVYSVVFHALLMPIIVDVFRGLFEGLGGQLPRLTSIVFGLYEVPRRLMSAPLSASIYFVAVVAIAVVLGWFALRFPRLRVSLFVPLARRYVLFETSAAFCGALAMMLEHGIPAAEAVRLASRVPVNRYLGRRLEGAADRIESGANIAECLRSEGALVAAARWRLWSAYYRSQLVEELEAVSGWCREQMANTEFRIVNSTRLVAGGVAAVILIPIAIVVVAFYLPMFSLVSQIG